MIAELNIGGLTCNGLVFEKPNLLKIPYTIIPTRFYDGAMYEWHSLSNVVASDGNAILPWDSPWRTDQTSISMFLEHSDPAVISPRNINDAYASSANAIINEDLAYKGVVVDDGTNNAVIIVDGGSSGGGGVLPPNPCGG